MATQRTDNVPAPLTLGESRIRVNFQERQNSELYDVKCMFAHLINRLADTRGRNKDPEFQRVTATAMTQIEDACMWATKSASWEHPKG